MNDISTPFPQESDGRNPGPRGHGDFSTICYRQRLWAFLRSPHHVGLALFTLGMGYASGQSADMWGGIVFYGLGWLYIPNSLWFRKWLWRRKIEPQQREEIGKIVDFQQRMKAIYRSLSRCRQKTYQEIVKLGRDIEGSLYRGSDKNDTEFLQPPLRQVDRLMWTYLNLLRIEQNQDELLQREIRENIQEKLSEAQMEIFEMEKQLAELQEAGDMEAWESLNKLHASRKERQNVLSKRVEHVARTKENLRLTQAELDRLSDLLKLMQSEVHNLRDATQLSPEINLGMRTVTDTLGGLTSIADLADLEEPPLPNIRQRFGYDFESRL